MKEWISADGRWSDKESFIRIMQEGPTDPHDILWLYLYREGLYRVPLSLEIRVAIARMGNIFTPILKGIVANIMEAINAE